MLIAVFLAVVVLSATSAEVWRRWALHRGVVDQPGARSSHVIPTPRGSGIGIVLGLLPGMALLMPASAGRDAAMLAIALVALVGLIDDLRPLPPFVKLAGQAIAALPLALQMPWPLLPALGLPSVVEEALAHGLAFAFALLAVNAWNFMDGINGIAAMAALAVAAVVLLVPDAGPVDGAALALAAACLGFLPLNFPRARVFMGDCGSHALGMAIAALVLFPSAGIAGAAGAATLAALAAASPFLIDVLGTLVRRALDRERLTQAHRRHLYQVATRSGYSHAVVTGAYGAWTVASGGCVVVASAFDAGGAVLPLVLAVNAGLWWAVSRHFEGRGRREGKG